MANIVNLHDGLTSEDCGGSWYVGDCNSTDQTLPSGMTAVTNWPNDDGSCTVEIDVEGSSQGTYFFSYKIGAGSCEECSTVQLDIGTAQDGNPVTLTDCASNSGSGIGVSEQPIYLLDALDSGNAGNGCPSPTVFSGGGTWDWNAEAGLYISYEPCSCSSGTCVGCGSLSSGNFLQATGSDIDLSVQSPSALDNPCVIFPAGDSSGCFQAPGTTKTHTFTYNGTDSGGCDITQTLSVDVSTDNISVTPSTQNCTYTMSWENPDNDTIVNTDNNIVFWDVQDDQVLQDFTVRCLVEDDCGGGTVQDTIMTSQTNAWVKGVLTENGLQFEWDSGCSKGDRMQWIEVGNGMGGTERINFTRDGGGSYTEIQDGETITAFGQQIEDEINSHIGANGECEVIVNTFNSSIIQINFKIKHNASGNWYGWTHTSNDKVSYSEVGSGCTLATDTLEYPSGLDILGAWETNFDNNTMTCTYNAPCGGTITGDSNSVKIGSVGINIDIDNTGTTATNISTTTGYYTDLTNVPSFTNNNINCSNEILTVSGYCPGGGNATFEWFALSGGSIVDGQGTDTITTNGTGNYHVLVSCDGCYSCDDHSY